MRYLGLDLGTRSTFRAVKKSYTGISNRKNCIGIA